VKGAEVHQLEYCLALHAEENAIIQSSKIGGMGLKGGTIYTTDQPCTLCAKKIQQVGLSKVVYTEAYPQSLSKVYMKDGDLKQFEGVKPRAYIKLFMPNHDQKEWQELESQNLVPMI
jgi:dCMP deaminase